METLESKLRTQEQILLQVQDTLTTERKSLSESRQALQSVRNELTEARMELSRAYDSIESVNRLLTSYSEVIKKQESVSKRKQWQKGFWGAVGGAVLTAIFCHK